MLVLILHVDLWKLNTTNHYNLITKSETKPTLDNIYP